MSVLLLTLWWFTLQNNSWQHELYTIICARIDQPVWFNKSGIDLRSTLRRVLNRSAVWARSNRAFGETVDHLSYNIPSCLSLFMFTHCRPCLIWSLLRCPGFSDIQSKGHSVLFKNPSICQCVNSVEGKYAMNVICTFSALRVGCFVSILYIYYSFCRIHGTTL